MATRLGYRQNYGKLLHLKQSQRVRTRFSTLSCIRIRRNWSSLQNVLSISNQPFSRHSRSGWSYHKLRNQVHPEGVSPEEILAYIYAILYSPAYRERYYEFLKYGFPRIPLPRDIEHFRKLGTLGQDLIDWHILKDRQIPHQHRFEGAGEGVVSKVRYADGGVWINPTQHFTDVPVDVWGYEVGAYQVCEKWLKDRQGSALSRAEVQQYRGILVAVAETLRFMAAIDAVIGAFPI